ncbi:MAG: group III truncated hemoglobin, partial [Campylobacter sp.]
EIFYEKIREDNRGLGEIFNAKIGTDDESWKVHKAKIANFWYGMMLGSGNFAGNPMKAHADLMEEKPFKPEMFDFWLGLFKESLNKLYTDEVADDFHARAAGIGQRFKYLLFGTM